MLNYAHRIIELPFRPPGIWSVHRTSVALCTAVFTEEAKGLCHVLTQVCPRPKPQMWDLSLETRNHWMEIDKSEITMKRVLGSGNFGEVWYGKSQMTSAAAAG